jgi:hypothetical protein
MENLVMRALPLFASVLVLSLAGSAQAAVKFYDSNPNNGTPGDRLLNTPGLCPPMRSTPDVVFGFMQLADDGLGTVTMMQHSQQVLEFTDLGAEVLTQVLGPGAFIFIDNKATTSIVLPATSNTSGIGAHGPSGTAPGESAEWGVVSGFVITGRLFCLSSPTTICTNAGLTHGATTPRELASDTYDLGTWTFDAVGDYEQTVAYIQVTSSGGTVNSLALLRGTFVGANLPALPLVGFSALALSLAVIGVRALLGKK